MRNRATEFLDRWEFQHVTVVPPAKRAEEAQRLALKCREDAAAAGINGEDLEAAVGGDLVGNMVQALGAAAFRELAREQWADEDRDADS